MTQQERFEAWATSQGINITDNGFGGYDSQWTEGALAGWEAAQAQAASTKDFSNLTNQAHGYSDVVSLGGMDPRNYAAANGVRQAAVKPVAYLTETEQGPMVWTPDMYGEACTYCDDGEFPVPLYTSPPDSPKAAQQWRPIESAPKDFTSVFDGWNGDRVCEIQWARPEYAPKDYYAWCYSEYENGYGWVNHEAKGLTHWMPLPLPPVESDDIGGHPV